MAGGFNNLFGNTQLGRALGLKDPNASTTVNFYNSSGQQLEKDRRVRILAPSSYVNNDYDTTNYLSVIGGIIFPYTPQISLEHKAEYSNVNVVHSNFAQYFYQRSSVGQITITGKFTVQSVTDAEFYLSTVHLLRALTKMQTQRDVLPGAPPPVCRLYAYGEYMLDNVPVVVATFRNDLPNNVDYFSISKSQSRSVFGEVMVPVSSEISVTLIPMYSRNEQQNFSVTRWLGGNLNKQGFL